MRQLCDRASGGSGFLGHMGSGFRFDRLARLLLIVLAATAAGCAAGESEEPASLDDLASRSLATIDGELAVAGLKEPVEVIRDEWGVPHIYAQNDDDLFFAQGYVMAQDRLWQMEMWRRWREGRLAEIFGPEALDYDRRTRLMMFRGPWDETEWTSYHPDAHRLFTAHANGVNAFVEQNRDNLPVEFQLTGVEPLPWTAETAVLRWAALGVPSVRGHASTRCSSRSTWPATGRRKPIGASRRTRGTTWWCRRDSTSASSPRRSSTRCAPGTAIRSWPGVCRPWRSSSRTARWLRPPGLQTRQVSPRPVATEGSNNWVMTGERSPSGVPILANDPHRRIEMPALRYFVHLVAPGWNVIGGGEPPFAGVDAGSNERMAWGFTFAGTDMVDVYVEELHPEDPNLVRWQDGWEPLRVIEEEIPVKGQEPEPVVLKFSRHGPVFYEDLENRVAYAVRSVVQEPGTAAYKGSFQLAQAESCADFFERAMHWLVPTHSLVCGDADGNIALQVTGLTPDRDGWNGRLPVPGNGDYEWRGFREDLPREFNPERGYVATANNNVHPPGYEGRPVFYHTSRGVETSRIARLHQILGAGEVLSVDDHKRIQHDSRLLAAERDIPAFQGWTSDDPDVEWARGLIAEWDATVSRESTAGALYVRWNAEVDDAVRDPETPEAERQASIEQGLTAAIERLTAELGPDRAEWRHGRVHASELRHMLAPAFDLPAVERPGGFGSLNATGANFRRIIDLADPDRSVASNAPGQSAQPGSPYYGNLAANLGNGEYFPLLYTRGAVEERAAHKLTLQPAGD